MLFLLIAAFLGMVAWEVPGLVRQNLWRELAVFLLVWAVGFTLSLLLTLHVNLPNPVDGIEFLVGKVTAAFR